MWDPDVGYIFTFFNTVVPIRCLVIRERSSLWQQPRGVRVIFQSHSINNYNIIFQVSTNESINNNHNNGNCQRHIAVKLE